MRSVKSRDMQGRAGGPQACVSEGPGTCRFVDAKEKGYPQGGKMGSKWRQVGILQTTVGGSGGYVRLWQIGYEKVDCLRPKITVTVNSLEGCEVRGPLYTGKTGQLNVGSRVQACTR